MNLATFINPILNIFRNHKLKILGLFLSFIFFMYLLFPFNDLGDFVATKIAQVTQSQVIVDFDSLTFSFFPQPGLSLTNVSVETPFTPSLTAKYLEVAPSIMGLLALKPGVTVRAEDLLGGDLTLSTRGGDKISGSKMKQKVSLDLSRLNLGNISKVANLPMKVEGFISGSVDSQVDPDLGEQPTADMTGRFEKVVFPEGTLLTPAGPLPVPTININDVSFEGHLDKGTLDVTKLVLGRPGGDLYVNLNGKVDVKVVKGGLVPVIVGGYEFNVHVQLGDVLKKSFGLYLPLLAAYQAAGNTYAFSMTGTGTNSPPSLGRIL